jgi:predicted nucleic acid-binding protein
VPNETKNIESLTIDSSVIVAYLINEIEHNQTASSVWDRIFNNGTIVFIPVTVLSEVVSAVRRRTGSITFSDAVKKLLISSHHFRLIDINLERSIKSAEIAIQYGLRGMDSIVVQVSEEYETELITFDNEIKEKYLSKVKRK